MKRIDITPFFENFPLEPELQLDMLEMYHDKYPASHFVTFFYLKMLQEKSPKEYELQKGKLLLSICNRNLFRNCKLEYFVATEPPPANGDEIAKLVAQFQQNSPKIKYDPAKHNAEINLAEQGEIENIDFISETLAMVYAEQGYTGKAVQMIKKLMLQNPEKNAYFAALVETVKNSMNTNENLEENNQ